MFLLLRQFANHTYLLWLMHLLILHEQIVLNTHWLHVMISPCADLT